MITPHVAFTRLAAERVVLRRFRPGDLPVFAAYRSDPAVARFQGWPVPYPLAEAERFHAGLAQAHPDTPGEWFQFAVALRGSDELIGDCGAQVHDSDPRQVTVGYTFAAGHQGHGYATEAVRRLLDYWFFERGKHRVVASCDERNVRSSALLRRVGMRREGLEVESVWDKGGWTNEEQFAVLHREWTSGGQTAGPG